MIYTIPDSQRIAERMGSDLAWRGIRWPACSQYKRRGVAPDPISFEACGAARSDLQELEAYLRRPIR